MPDLIPRLRTNYTANRDFHYIRVSVLDTHGMRSAFGSCEHADARADYGTGANVCVFAGLPSSIYLIELQLLDDHLRTVAFKRIRATLAENMVVTCEIGTPPPHIDLNLPPILPRG